MISVHHKTEKTAGDIMANPYKEKVKENKRVKRLRITCAVFFFIEVILTTFPYIWGPLEDGTMGELTAFQMMIQIGGYKNSNAVMLAVFCAVFVIFPLAGFFVMILDKKTYWKYLVSASCCIICSALITFGISGYIDIGAVVAMLLYILILFLTAFCFVTDYADKNSQDKKRQ